MNIGHEKEYFFTNGGSKLDADWGSIFNAD